MGYQEIQGGIVRPQAKSSMPYKTQTSYITSPFPK